MLDQHRYAGIIVQDDRGYPHDLGWIKAFRLYADMGVAWIVSAVVVLKAPE